MPQKSNEQLCAEWQQGEHAALDALVEQNLSFVRHEANRLANRFRRCDLADDLIQEGTLGLIEAAGQFDAKRKNSFLTYAGYWVRKHFFDCMETEIARETVNFTETEPHAEQESWIIDGSCCGKSPEQLLIHAETMAELHHAMDMISDRDAAYLRYRFGFPDGDANRTRKETAEHFHLSETRAIATENLALDNLQLELPWWYG